LTPVNARVSAGLRFASRVLSASGRLLSATAAAMLSGMDAALAQVAVNIRVAAEAAARMRG